MTWLVFKFLCTVYDKHIIWTEQVKKDSILWKIKQIMQHVLKMQQISLLPKSTKRISRSIFLLVFTHTNTGHLKVNLHCPIKSALNKIYKSLAAHCRSPNLSEMFTVFHFANNYYSLYCKILVRMIPIFSNICICNCFFLNFDIIHSNECILNNNNQKTPPKAHKIRSIT
jgi:hypothetical protein